MGQEYEVCTKMLTNICNNFLLVISRDGTVTGQLEGDQARVSEMRSWLETTGSPQSRIDRAEFRNVRQINNFSFEHFKIIR